jgi:hypothetical protein
MMNTASVLPDTDTGRSGERRLFFFDFYFDHFLRKLQEITSWEDSGGADLIPVKRSTETGMLNFGSIALMDLESGC